MQAENYPIHEEKIEIDQREKNALNQILLAAICILRDEL
jgi:hypothetical protein